MLNGLQSTDVHLVVKMYSWGFYPLLESQKMYSMKNDVSMIIILCLSSYAAETGLQQRAEDQSRRRKSGGSHYSA
jgi:hypothetical protein